MVGTFDAMGKHTTASAELRHDQFEAGHLPPVCVVSGEPATVMVRRTAESPVGAAYLGLFLGVVTYLVIRAVTVKRVQGGLPYNKEAGKRDPAYRERRRNSVIAAGVAAALTTVAILIARSSLVDPHGSPRLLIWLAGIVLGAATLVFLAFAARQPLTWVRPVYDQRRTGNILVSKVHPRFVEALAAAPVVAPAAERFVPPPAGWFPDPTGVASQRYWSGQAWTDRIHG